MEIGPELQLWARDSSSTEQNPLQRPNRNISLNGLPMTQPYIFPVEQLNGLELELESDSDVGNDSSSNWFDDSFTIARIGPHSSPRQHRGTPEMLDDSESPRLLIADVDPPSVPAPNVTKTSSPINVADNLLTARAADQPSIQQSPVPCGLSASGTDNVERCQESESLPNSPLPAEAVVSDVQEAMGTSIGAVSDGHGDRSSCSTQQSATERISPPSTHGQKAYAHCSLCNRTFRDKRSLNIHITKAHANTKVVLGNAHNTSSGGLKLRLVSLPSAKRPRRSTSLTESQSAQRSTYIETIRNAEKESLSVSPPSGGGTESGQQEIAVFSTGVTHRLRTTTVDRTSYSRGVSAKRTRQSSHAARRHPSAHGAESSTGSTTPMEHCVVKYNETQSARVPLKRTAHRVNEHIRPLMDTSLRTTDGSYKCRLCRRVFPSRFSLTGHYKSHYTASQKPYRCDECGQRYTSPSNLHYHRSRNCVVLKLRAIKDKQRGSSLSPHSLTMLECKAKRVAERWAYFHEATQDEKSSVESCATEDRSTIPGQNGSRTTTPDQGPADATSTDSVAGASSSTRCKCTTCGPFHKSSEASRIWEPPTSACLHYHTSEWLANSSHFTKPSGCSVSESGCKCKHSVTCQSGVTATTKPGETKCDMSHRENHFISGPTSYVGGTSSLHVQLRNLLERACQCETTRQKILAFTTFALISALSQPNGKGEQCNPEPSSNGNTHSRDDINHNYSANLSLSQATSLLSSLVDSNNARRDPRVERLLASSNRVHIGYPESDPMCSQLHKPVSCASPSTSSSTATDTASVNRPGCAHCSCSQSTPSEQESYGKSSCFSHSVARSAFSAPSEQDRHLTPPCSHESRSNLNSTDSQSDLVFPAFLMALNGWPTSNMENRYLVPCSDCDRHFPSPTACRVHYTTAHMSEQQSKRSDVADP